MNPIDGNPIGVLSQFETELSETHQLTGYALRRDRGESLVVLLPSARKRGSDPQTNLVHRLSWVDSFPTSHVLALADPVSRAQPQLVASWFVSDYEDLLQEIGAIIVATALSWCVSLDRILFYGSSVGGFAALHLAALVQHAYAVAEVPQIDLETWPDKETLAELAQAVGDLDEIRPERIDVNARFATCEFDPEFFIVTNADDASYSAQQALVEKHPSGSILVTSAVRGHAPLPRDLAVSLCTLALSKSLQRPHLLDGAAARVLCHVPPGEYELRLSLRAFGSAANARALVALGSRSDSTHTSWEVANWMHSPVPEIGLFRYVKIVGDRTDVALNLSVPTGAALDGFRVIAWEAEVDGLSIDSWSIKYADKR